MVSLDERLILLRETVSKNAYGVISEQYSETQCFCGRESVTQNEFALMGKLGLKPTYRATIRAEMYGGEKLCLYRDEIYDIYRVYKKDKEYAELYLTPKEGEPVTPPPSDDGPPPLGQEPSGTSLSGEASIGGVSDDGD